MQLNELQNNPGSTHRRKRVGRGIASGKGKTCGAGQKGQKSRTGVSIKGFEGGQMPLYQRLPKRGFTNVFRKNLGIVNLSDLQAALDRKSLTDSKPISRQELIQAGLLREKAEGVKLLGKGDLKVALELVVDKASASAIKAVEKAKGKVTLQPTKVSKIVAKPKKAEAKQTSAKDGPKKSKTESKTKAKSKSKTQAKSKKE